MSFLHQVHTI